MIASRRPYPGAAAGFTLVELLLAIMLLSILLALAYGGLRAATRASENGERILDAGTSVRASQQFVRRQINQMLPLPFAVAEDDEQTRLVFVGGPRSITYVAPMPGYLGSGGPQVQLLEFADADDGEVLQLSHALLMGFEESQLFERDPVVLMDDIESGSFEFLGRDEDGELTGWSQNWDYPDRLPAAVRLSVGLTGSAQVQWPELVAGVRVDAETVQGGWGRQSYEQTIRDLMNRGRGSKTQ